MITVEFILMIVAYSALIITIFLEIICYRKNLETLETLAFTGSLLFLIIALTASPFLGHSDAVETTNIFSLLAMNLVALTTPINVLSERQNNIHSRWKKMLVAVFTVLTLAVIWAHFYDALEYLQYIVVVFLGGSILFSMVFIRYSKPHKRIAHREKAEQVFAKIFMIFVPISLVANYMFASNDVALKIGFTLPLVFILLAGSKFLDDLQRLSLVNPKHEIKEQNFKNYQLTAREREIAENLIKGISYKEIAEQLFISLPTVKTHASNIYRKCGVKSRAELTARLIN